MDRAGQEMHNNIEKLKAAKEYLAQKLNDAQTRIGSTSAPPTVEITADAGLAAEAVLSSWTGLDAPVGTSGVLRPPAAAWVAPSLGEEAVSLEAAESSNVPLHAPSRSEGAVATTPPPLSPSLSASVEDGAGSCLANSLVGSAVIIEDTEILESRRRNEQQANEAAVPVVIDGTAEIKDASDEAKLLRQLPPALREAATRSPARSPIDQLGDPSSVANGPCVEGDPAAETRPSEGLLAQAKHSLAHLLHLDGEKQATAATTSEPVILEAVSSETTPTLGDSRLVRTSAELAACRDELNSAVHEATSLRLSEAAVSERSSEAVDRLRAVAGLTAEEAPPCVSRQIINGQDEVPPGAARLRAELEAFEQRIARLEASNQELEMDRKAAYERIASLEARNSELEKQLEAQPYAQVRELEERLATTRLQSEEVMKECEHRQETLEAMESRLQQAERLVLQTGAANGNGVGAAPLGTAALRANALANGAVAEGVTLEAARERVKILYEQLSSRNVQIDSADGTSAIQRLGVAAQIPGDKQSLASTLMAIAASITQPSPALASNASGISTPTVALQPVSRSSSPLPVVAQPAVVSVMTPKTRLLDAVQMAPASIKKAAVGPPVSVGSSISTVQAASPGPPTPQSSTKFLAASPPHVEVRRFKQNVDDLQSLVMQMVGDKTRAVNGLEQKVAELETMVEQVGKGTQSPIDRSRRSSLDTQVPILVGSISSSTATLSPNRLGEVREIVAASPGSLSPGPRGMRLARTSSPVPGTSMVRVSVRQAATSPSPLTRRTVSPSPVRTAVLSARPGLQPLVTSRVPSRQASRSSTPLPVSRATSPAPVSTAAPISSQTTSPVTTGNMLWQIPSSLTGPVRFNGQAST